MRSNLFGVLLLIMVAGVTFVTAQPTMRTPTGAASENTFKDLRQRAAELERIRREGREVLTNEPRLNWRAIAEDFDKLQVVNSERLQKSVFSQTNQTSSIVKAVRELRKRATRLGHNLFPGAGEMAVYQADLQNATLPSLAIAVDNAVTHIVASPIFRDMKAFRAQDVQRLRIELKKIDVLTSVIEKRLRP